MTKKTYPIAINAFVALAGLCMLHATAARGVATPYTAMAPVDQYLMADRQAEIALARSAAPASIARDATVLVLGRHGFEPAVEGRNGFVCIVARSWTSAPDADFWNPKVRVPMCANAAGARSYFAHIFKWTELALAGRTKAQMAATVADAIRKNELPTMAPGAMCYMMSRHGFGGDAAPHWPSHLMFFYTDVTLSSWGANLPGSPVVGLRDDQEHLTEFVIPVQQWSDGTDAVSATAGSAGTGASPEHAHR